MFDIKKLKENPDINIYSKKAGNTLDTQRFCQSKKTGHYLPRSV
jgi:hypothetical protein